MEPVRVLRDDLILVDWGPMTLTISAWLGDEAAPVIAAQSARLALRCLSALADYKNYLNRPSHSLPSGRPLPSVVERARKAARALDSDLTPMAAVAGAVADEVAEFAAGLGADKVIVNNGGDIALRLAPGQEVLVGVREPGDQDGEPGRLWGRLRIRGGQGIGGVASSGWRGRSVSKGVADLATVWASSAALADAAATLLGNHVSLDSPQIKTAPAGELPGDNGLGDCQVTTDVGELSLAERRRALESGQSVARDLRNRNMLTGCLLAVQGEMALLDPGDCLALTG